MPTPAYLIKAIALANVGRQEITWAEHQMPGLMHLREVYAPSQPLQGVRITGCVHMTAQTAVLIETLRALGADVRWASCNIASTQDTAAAAVAAQGTPVFAWKNQSLIDYWTCVHYALTWDDNRGPNLVIDSGGDATLIMHKGFELENGSNWAFLPADNQKEYYLKTALRSIQESQPRCWQTTLRDLQGITEDTSTGVRRLYQMLENGSLRAPVININNSLTKSKFDNFYGCGESLIDGIKHTADITIAGKVAVVCGYGSLGKGCAQALRNIGTQVIVTEIDPICALQAAMEGFCVTTVEDTLGKADIYVTATGNCDVLRLEHMAKMKDQAVLCNIGHFDNEIQVHALNTHPDIIKNSVRPQVNGYTLPNGITIYVLAEGQLINFACAQGHSSFVMSMSFCSQVFAMLDLWKNRKHTTPRVYTLLKHFDEEVARLHLDKIGIRLTTLSQKQANYLNIPTEKSL